MWPSLVSVCKPLLSHEQLTVMLHEKGCYEETNSILEPGKQISEEYLT
jgi:hypothetical protein